MWFTELFKLDKIRDRITSQESKRVLAPNRRTQLNLRKLSVNLLLRYCQYKSL